MSDGKGRRPLTSKERKRLEKQRKNAAKQAEKYHKEKAKQDKKAKKSPNTKKEQQKKASADEPGAHSERRSKQGAHQIGHKLSPIRQTEILHHQNAGIFRRQCLRNGLAGPVRVKELQLDMIRTPVSFSRHATPKPASETLPRAISTLRADLPTSRVESG